jgi:hypothetical protein
MSATMPSFETLEDATSRGWRTPEPRRGDRAVYSDDGRKLLHWVDMVGTTTVVVTLGKGSYRLFPPEARNGYLDAAREVATGSMPGGWVPELADWLQAGLFADFPVLEVHHNRYLASLARDREVVEAASGKPVDPLEDDIVPSYETEVAHVAYAATLWAFIFGHRL